MIRVMGSILDIFEGWKNSIIINEDVEAFAIQRLKICFNCEHRNTVMYNKCGKCGCPISKKVRARKSTCPVGKW